MIRACACAKNPPEGALRGAAIEGLAFVGSLSKLMFRHLFLMFRSGSIGFALVILRLSLMATLSLHAIRFAPSVSLLWSGPVILVALALGLGAMTATACILYCAAEICFLLNTAKLDPLVPVLAIPVAVALALLGPGAYSLDARIFGRRVIVFPRDDNQ
jgi:hypothetical protein